MTNKEQISNILKNYTKKHGIMASFVILDEYAAELEANGAMIIPYKVGDKIYKIWSCGKHGKSIAEFEIAHIDIDNYPTIEIAFCKPNSKATYPYYFAKSSDIGKTVFLDKKEAEKVLKENQK